MVMFTFSALELKFCFWANLVQKLKNDLPRLKFGTETNSNRELVEMSTLFVLH